MYSVHVVCVCVATQRPGKCCVMHRSTSQLGLAHSSLLPGPSLSITMEEYNKEYPECYRGELERRPGNEAKHTVVA